ncbi:MerR family transcriptional regulator [Blastococcus haudaquaticus]|uniref:DNA-binding transcriptional regulator, MerR family n=1 Tax=Blastococcus haudaquaticus TaxID=1938745 RepID=A0A286H2S8_9ACTN|nr:MerR family transcriptional regulator [Blastococcus haudaquaticus]SOE02002.1 DNA-binding transcriptional regulator, MerR family [Blastococcus haudaquaticus]
MRIGELQRRTGVNQRLLRYYEEQRLLTPMRRASGYREYAEGDVRTVQHIRTLLAAGLPTATIAEVLPCLATDGDRLVVPDCAEVLDELQRERDRLTDAIHGLEAARSELDGIIARAPAGMAPSTCD